MEANTTPTRAQPESRSSLEPLEPGRLSWIGCAGCSFFRNHFVVRSLRTSIGPRLALALSCERIRHAIPSLPSQSSRPSARRPRSRGARTRDAPSINHPTGRPRELHPNQLTLLNPNGKRDLGCSAPWRRTPHPLARSAKAHPFQSLLSARRPWSRGARTRDAPFEGLSYRAMRRSFRTHRFGVSRTQGFTLGWYAVPRWGTPKIHPTN